MNSPICRQLQPMSQIGSRHTAKKSWKTHFVGCKVLVTIVSRLLSTCKKVIIEHSIKLTNMPWTSANESSGWKKKSGTPLKKHKMYISLGEWWWQQMLKKLFPWASGRSKLINLSQTSEIQSNRLKNSQHTSRKSWDLQSLGWKVLVTNVSEFVFACKRLVKINDFFLKLQKSSRIGYKNTRHTSTKSWDLHFLGCKLLVTNVSEFASVCKWS